jgi:hypothetical protein
LRGLEGTEALATRSLAANLRVVLIDGALQPLETAVETIGKPANYRVPPPDQDHAHPFTIEVPSTATGLAFLPRSPVRLKARRQAGGVAISWIRRTRMNGDSWELAEVPLGEQELRFRLEILSGATVKRSVEVASEGWLYASADEIADFGSPQASHTIRLAQLSALVGAGAALTRTLLL